jgi:tRNA G18 (ribose-2'-O)-methylase SpoU
MTTELNVCRIDSLDEPELQPYGTLRRPMKHIRAGIFVAEGDKVVRRLLDSKLTIVSMLVTPEWYQLLLANKHQISRIEHPFTIFIAEKSLLESIVGYNLHQGIMAVAKVPAEQSLDETIAAISKPHLLVALDGLVNAENVGVVVRNCAAFGADAIVVGETSSSPYLRRAVRNSMGTVFQLRIVHTTDLIGSLIILRRDHGTRIVAAHPHSGSIIDASNLTENLCIVLGNEGSGVSPRILEICTDHIAIPMMNQTDSLNVASASAVFLYEAWRQRSSVRKK